MLRDAALHPQAAGISLLVVLYGVTVILRGGDLRPPLAKGIATLHGFLDRLAAFSMRHEYATKFGLKGACLERRHVSRLQVAPQHRHLFNHRILRQIE